jgi:predicted flap endonuclease-1-like 5' DNA nuclease
MTALPKIGRPAAAALEAIGITTLEEAAKLSEAQLLATHGVGPKAVRILREALAERGMEVKA